MFYLNSTIRGINFVNANLVVIFWNFVNANLVVIFYLRLAQWCLLSSLYVWPFCLHVM